MTPGGLVRLNTSSINTRNPRKATTVMFGPSLSLSELTLLGRTRIRAIQCPTIRFFAFNQLASRVPDLPTDSVTQHGQK